MAQLFSVWDALGRFRRFLEVGEQIMMSNSFANGKTSSIIVSVATTAAVLFLAATADAQNRIALVIGNDRYQSLPEDKQLSKAVNDARTMGTVLEKLGFVVIRGENLSRQGMIDHLFAFTEKIKPGDLAVLFYAGHGIAFSGANYLLPSDVQPAEPDQQARVVKMAIGEADIISDIQERKARVAVMILDACRDNPFRRPGITRTVGTPRGLTRSHEGEGVFAVYSAGFGQAALDSLGPDDKSPNSVFTRVLAPALARSELHLGELVIDVREQVAKLAASINHKQYPAYYDQTLGGRIFLAPKRGAKMGGDLSLVVPPMPLTTERLPKATEGFKDCDVCPEMLVVQLGSFMMGSQENEKISPMHERPYHKVTISRAFAVGRFPITFSEWDACVASGGCNSYRPSDEGWGRDRRPVINVSWNDAQAYVKWLSTKTSKNYRLLTESEREYIGRAGTTTPFWWGTTISTEQANYNGAGFDGGPRGQQRGRTVPVETFAPNPWGFYQVHGNVWEWVEDCFEISHDNAHADGSARRGTECPRRVLRGGSWYSSPIYLRSASRFGGIADKRNPSYGFRVARSLN